MGPSSFVKFCKIGALSATGTRPFGDGADGFVMGEGAGAFLLKRLADAERDGDRIYAVMRGVGGSSDGKGKGITAPNPVGQKLAVQRAWEDAGLDPATATLVEAHGTSTKVGDVVEVNSLAEMFKGAGASASALGSAKSNVGPPEGGRRRGRLAEGRLRAALQDHPADPPRRAAEPEHRFPVHAVLPAARGARVGEAERHAAPLRRQCLRVRRHQLPHRARGARAGLLDGGSRSSVAVDDALGQRDGHGGPVQVSSATGAAGRPARAAARHPRDRRASSSTQLKEKLEEWIGRVKDGHVPPVAPPSMAELSAPERLVIDFGTRDELLRTVC